MRVAVLALALLLPGSARAQTLDARPFAEREVGDFHDYTWNLGPDLRIDTPRSDPIQGVETVVTRWIGGGQSGLETNRSYRDGVGAEVWRGLLPDQFDPFIGGFDGLTSFDPPLLELPASIEIGRVYEVSGSATVTLVTSQGNFISTGSYVSRYSFLLEEVRVPYGVFPALRQDSNNTVSVEGQTRESATVEWYVEGLGSVALASLADGRTDIYRLVDTNRQYLPEPGAWLSGASALLALLALRRQRAA